MRTLSCMKKSTDGAHRGLGDWYPKIEQGIVAALKKGPKSKWTTGWYASKHEIASAKITCLGNGKIEVEASVSDDFDTDGTDSVTIPFTTDLEKIRTAVYAAWNGAETNQKDNQMYTGFKVLHQEVSLLKGKRKGPFRSEWVETYIAPAPEASLWDSPPGDYYHQWGWQGDCKLPADVKVRFERWLSRYLCGEAKTSYCSWKGWKIEPWEWEGDEESVLD
jgi:hypothetical protein